jgi:flagellar basal body P-ring formation protein FlgA
MGAVAVRCPAFGWRIRVPIVQFADAGSKAAPLVRRGDVVEVVAIGAGYSVSSSGTAMEEGGKGAAVRIKTGNASAPLTATVLDVGRVVINN